MSRFDITYLMPWWMWILAILAITILVAALLVSFDSLLRLVKP